MQVWARDLANGDKCVVLYNSGASKENGQTDGQKVGVTWEMLGWNGSDVRVQVRDLWAQATLGNFTRGYNATLKPRDVQMLRVKKLVK